MFLNDIHCITTGTNLC